MATPKQLAALAKGREKRKKNLATAKKSTKKTAAKKSTAKKPTAKKGSLKGTTERKKAVGKKTRKSEKQMQFAILTAIVDKDMPKARRILKKLQK